MPPTLEELVPLDGASSIPNEGVTLPATRYLDAATNGLDVPGGLDSRCRARRGQA